MATRYIVSSEKKQKKALSITSRLKKIQSNKAFVKQDKMQKKNCSNKWINRHINDPFVQASKQDGFVSRAAYKLIEIDQKYKILHTNDSVIDIGCSPGSWMQVIWQKIKSKYSALIGIDLLPINDDIAIALNLNKNKQIYFIQGDFLSEYVQQKIQSRLLGKKVNCIVCDIAHNTVGIKAIDHIKSMELVESVILFISEKIAKHGNFITKIFDGEGTKDIVISLRKMFKKVIIHKPIASRQKSSEIYLIAMDYKNNTETN